MISCQQTANGPEEDKPSLSGVGRRESGEVGPESSYQVYPLQDRQG